MTASMLGTTGQGCGLPADGAVADPADDAPFSIKRYERYRRSGDMRLDRIVVINDLSVARGGATGLALLSARLFHEQGIPVTYLCGDDGESAELAALGIEIVALGGEHILTGNRRRALFAGLHNAGAKTLIEGWIDEHDTERTVYHVHGWSKILSPAIFIALSKVARRTVLHAHDYFLACPNGAFYHYPSQTPCNCRPLSGECIASNCDRRSYAQKIWRMGRSARLRSVLFHNGTLPQTIILLHEKMAPFFQKSRYPDLSLSPLRNPVVPYRHERVKAEDNRDFFFIGRLAAEKGIEDAIIASIRAGVRLTIIGDGPLRDSISALSRNIHVLGWLSHHEIAERISSARAVLMPTRYPEPFGLVAMEASTSGIPVVVSEKAYLADEIVAAGLGFACDTSNPDAFATTLRKLADMPRDEIRAMSERAYRREAKLATTPEEWRDRLLDHYAACLKEDAPSPGFRIPGDGALYDAV